MSFTITPRALLAEKSANAAHAAAEGVEEHERQEPDSQMATGARKPLRTDDAAKASQRHPLTGQFVSDQTGYGATHGPLANALGQHRPHPAPLAELQTAGTGALASSITPGAVSVQRLDHRTATGPLAVSGDPIRPDFHTTPITPGARS